ncbi:hypothetical protein L7F22_042489 [Adiantum nelumboides]|nr:hypothetical protein [Adiantum nelumboides]
MNHKHRSAVMMLPARNGDGIYCHNATRDGDGQNHQSFGEPLFRPFASDHDVPWRREQSFHDSDDLLSGPPGFMGYGRTQNLIPTNMPVPSPHNAEPVCVDNAIKNTQSHPLRHETPRTQQQVDSAHESPSHLNSLAEDGNWHTPERKFSSRLWSVSEQVSLINAAEKCILKDKCWDREDRWTIVYAHMCNEGHVKCSGNKLTAKFAYLTKDYQRIRAWNSAKGHIPYEELPLSRRKANSLPCNFDNYLYKRMTIFFEKTSFVENTNDNVSKVIKRIKDLHGRFSVKTRASPRLKNMEDARNLTASTMQQQCKSVDGNFDRDISGEHYVDVDGNNGTRFNSEMEKVFGENVIEEIGDKDSSEEVADGDENVHSSEHYMKGNKQTRGRVFRSNGYASKETRPLKKQRAIPSRVKESKGTRRQAGHGGEDPVEPSQACFNKDQFCRPSAATENSGEKEEAFIDQIKSCDGGIAEMIPIMSTMSQACNQFSQAFSQTVMMKAALVRRFLGSEI